MLFNILVCPLWLGCILLRYCEFVGFTADSRPMLKISIRTMSGRDHHPSGGRKVRFNFKPLKPHLKQGCSIMSSNCSIGLGESYSKNSRNSVGKTGPMGDLPASHAISLSTHPPGNWASCIFNPFCYQQMDKGMPKHLISSGLLKSWTKSKSWYVNMVKQTYDVAKLLPQYIEC